ncbi:MAG TPA: hypothetical protein VHR66_30035 [Gemmataceae bacterium]|nr:hypothetical protein [Gemmataceae bacterium]
MGMPVADEVKFYSLRRWFRQHRAAVGWLFVVFALSQAVLAVYVDQHAPTVRDPEYYLLEGMLRERIAERPTRPTAMFLGSSRVAHGFDAAAATGNNDALVFNFGVPGSGPYLQTVMMDRLHAAGMRTDILFLEVLHPFYNTAGVRSLDGSLLDGARLSYEEAIGLRHYGSKSNSGPIRRWVYARLLPVYRHQAELRDQIGLDLFQPGEGPLPPFAPIDLLGYRRREIEKKMWPELTELAHKQYDPFYTAFQFDEAAWARLVATIDGAKAVGTDVVIVMMPEGSQFRDLATSEVRDGANELIRRLREQLQVTVADAREWLNDSAFYDQHHLLPNGAKTFAERFRVEALEPALHRAEKRIAGQSTRSP